MQYTWKDIEQHIAACTGCLLSQTRHRPVMGRGDYQADIMLIAEAPRGTGGSAGHPVRGAFGRNIRQTLAGLRTGKKTDLYYQHFEMPSSRQP